MLRDPATHSMISAFFLTDKGYRFSLIHYNLLDPGKNLSFVYDKTFETR